MTWKNPPTNFSIKVVRQLDSNIKKMTGEVLTTVITETPFDTGQARGNWRVNESTPSTATVKGGSKTALADGLAVIAAKGGLGKLVYISNYLPYIERLNNGWSDQAPINFVGDAVSRINNKYK